LENGSACNNSTLEQNSKSKAGIQKGKLKIAQSAYFSIIRRLFQTFANANSAHPDWPSPFLEVLPASTCLVSSLNLTHFVILFQPLFVLFPVPIPSTLSPGFRRLFTNLPPPLASVPSCLRFPIVPLSTSFRYAVLGRCRSLDETQG